MTLHQLSVLKQWHVAHRGDHPVEFHTWDAMLTFWVMGWMGMPAALILSAPLGLVLCVVLFFAPTLYVRTRQRLHQQHRLRCDWLDVTR
jgi:hypothetical protein